MKIEQEVEIPMTPNFIKVGDTHKPITDFTDDQLREIGKEWTEALVKKSRTRGGKMKLDPSQHMHLTD